MTFRPVIPYTGLVGWRFLQSTYDAQLQTFENSNQSSRETQYFLENIGQIATAEDLVADRRLLRVALTAFGLENDINNTYFIRKVLQDGTQASDALSNRLSEKRYKELSSSFGFGPGEVVLTSHSKNMAEIARKSLLAQFEISVGETDETMRVALYATHALEDLAEKAVSENAKWFELMSRPPLRTMMETALGLPSSFSQLDIDTQLERFRDKLVRQTGSANLSQFGDPDAVDRLTTLYFARAQMASFSAGQSSAQTALVLLQSG